MSGFLDDVEIEIPCSQCGRKMKKSIRWIKNNSEFTCACGVRIILDADQFRREIAEKEAQLRNLGNSFKKFKI